MLPASLTMVERRRLNCDSAMTSWAEQPSRAGHRLPASGSNHSRAGTRRDASGQRDDCAEDSGFCRATKPRIIELLLVTTVPTMFVARRGIPSGWLVLATLVGGTLSAGGANAVNMYIDRDIDAVMKRTSHRPLVTGVVRPTEALVFAIGLQVAAFAAFALFVNYYSGFLALGAALLRLRLHARAEEALEAEHRHRRRRRGRAGPDRLDGGHRSPRVGCGRALRPHRHLDAVALLGARRQVPGRLRAGRGADAARRRVVREGGAPDHLVLGRPRRRLVRVRRRRPHGLVYSGGRRSRRALYLVDASQAEGRRAGRRRAPCACSATRSPTSRLSSWRWGGRARPVLAP